MYKNIKRFTIFIALFAFTINIQADEKRVYSENDFINIFSGKPKARFLKYLGEPDNKEIAIKPKDASKVISRPTENKKKDKMEMWYYNHVVEYSPGKTYLKTEITFINDRCRSISFFNQ
jgi:hypothetical protein